MISIDYNRHLGYNSEYFVPSQNQCYSNFGEAIKALGKKRVIDNRSIFQVLNHYYALGDRTLIEGIEKAPWMSKWDDSKGEFHYSDLPKHGQTIEPVEKVARTFHQLLRNEIEAYLSNHRRIGLLLSGGMDSRIVAALLKEIQERDSKIEVVGLNWGIENSRDKVYAERICEKYNWDYKFFELGPELLHEAIIEVGKQGAEFSPVHIHAMHKIAQMDNLDCVLAGSYGDSVGRAEYSGNHVTKIKGLDKRAINWFNLLNQEVANKLRNDLFKLDVNLYRSRFPRNAEYQYREIERQCHYMRKMLNPCMGLINQRIPVYQVFTAPEVFGYIWSLDPSIRTDEVYYELLKNTASDLLDIPWARTGVPYYSSGQATPDDYSSLHNRYGDWIRNDLFEYIQSTLNSEYFKSLSIFNQGAVRSLLKTYSRYYKLPRRSKIDEFLVWLCSVTECVKEYNITSTNSKTSFVDSLLGEVTKSESYLFSKVYNKRYS